MNTISQYRPSKRPSVKQVQHWDTLFEQRLEHTWNSDEEMYVKVENGYPFPDFYRVTVIRGAHDKKSKLFYGESAWNETERFVYDLGIFSVSGMI